MATRFSPMRPSTRAFLKEAREIPDYSWFDRLHGYIYMRWPYFYIGVATGRHAFARRFRPLVRWLGRRIEGGEKGSGTADDGRDASSEVQAGAASAGIEVITWADTYHQIISGYRERGLQVYGLIGCEALDRYRFPLDTDVYYLDTLPVVVEPQTVVVVALSALAISFLATLYPSTVASKVDPVEGLRYE